MNWDYKNISGDFWNDLPLNEQMEYLEKYYPIGYVFKRIDYRIEFVIKDYVLVTGGSGAVMDGMQWYILKVVKNNADDYDSSENIHPGCFYPDIVDWRNKSLSKLGII